MRDDPGINKQEEEMRFLCNGGTIRDTKTGLMWLKNPYEIGKMPWDDAKVAVKRAYQGYSDWRLPTIQEFVNILDYSEYEPALPKDHPFYVGNKSEFWSATISSVHGAYAWGVRMYDGGVEYYETDCHLYVWPVRDGRNRGGHR